MELWQLLITFFAGSVTILTFFEKVGMIKKVKEQKQLQKNQNDALLAILRNELYRSFKENRIYNAWTMSESGVQHKMHQAYKALHGNGEEEAWWQHKLKWEILNEEEYHKLVMARKSE